MTTLRTILTAISRTTMATAVSPIFLQQAQWDSVLAEMRKNATGGAYDAIFSNKRLTMKVAAVKEKLTDLAEDAKGVYEALPPVSLELPPMSLPSITIPGILKALRQALGALRDLAAGALEFIRDKFMELLSVFAKLKDMLLEAFSGLMQVFDFIDMGAILDFMISLMPEVFVNFIGSIVAAIVPILQQLAAAWSLLKAIGQVVKTIVMRAVVGYSASFVASNVFNDAACAEILRMMDKDILKSSAALAKDIANTAISVAAAPVHGAGVISGVVTALAKLLIRIASYIAEYKSIQKANLYLDYIDYKPMDRNPVALFKASPVLGAIYLNRVSTSDLLPFSDVGGVRKPSFFNRNPKQMSLQTMQQVEIERLARKLDPLRTKSRKVEADSPLHLVTKGEAMTTAADEMKDVLKDAVKDQFKDFAKGAVGMSSD
jgi:hypothetical protein